jgi:hypothetical protein
MRRRLGRFTEDSSVELYWPHDLKGKVTIRARNHSRRTVVIHEGKVSTPMTIPSLVCLLLISRILFS